MTVVLACASCSEICLDGSIATTTSEQRSDTLSLAEIYQPLPPPADAGTCLEQCVHLFGSQPIDDCALFDDPDAGPSLTCVHTSTTNHCPPTPDDPARHFDDL